MKLIDLIVTLFKEFLLDGDTLTNVIRRNKMNTFLLFMNFVMLALFVFMFEQAVKNHEENIKNKTTLKDLEQKFTKGQEINKTITQELNTTKDLLENCQTTTQTNKQMVPVRSKPQPARDPSEPDLEQKLQAIRDREF